MANMMQESEKLSLQAANAIAVEMDLEVARTGCTYQEAAERVLRREAHLAAAYQGDVQTFTTLSARARSARMAAPASGTREQRFRRGAPPRALSSRRIADRSELQAGEVAVLKLAPDGCGGGLFAERIAA